MEEVWFVQNGKRRRGEKIVCGVCEKEFVRRASGKYKKQHCSVNCANIAHSQAAQIKVQCSFCGKEIVRAQSRVKAGRVRHGLSFCDRRCKEQAQSLTGNCPEIRPAHYGGDNELSDYRGRLREEIKAGCSVCGEKEEYKIRVHHIDGNRKNRQRSNMEVVCCNCHATRHLRLKDDVWIYDSHALTPRDVVEQLDLKMGLGAARSGRPPCKREVR